MYFAHPCLYTRCVSSSYMSCLSCVHRPMLPAISIWRLTLPEYSRYFLSSFRLFTSFLRPLVVFLPSFVLRFWYCFVFRNLNQRLRLQITSSCVVQCWYYQTQRFTILQSFTARLSGTKARLEIPKFVEICCRVVTLHIIKSYIS